MTSSTESAASTLCTACGMCCDGTLFPLARVSRAKNRIDLASLGLKVKHEDEKAQYFAQPCPALVNRCCTVYSQRPSVCASHRCKLLRELDTGDVALDDALAVVAETTTLRDRVVARLHERLGSTADMSFIELSERLHQSQAAAADPNAARAADMELGMDVAMLALRLQRRFRLSAAGQPPRALDEEATPG